MQGIKNHIEDMWKLVNKSEDCWLWTGKKDKDGYGVWWFEGKNVRPHRLVLEIYGKPIRPPKISRHLCHVRHCVNPEHIVEGTQKENVQDQLRLGTHSKLKYSDELVATVREEYQNKKITTRKLSEKYGISKSQIHLIVTNKTRVIEKELNGKRNS